jgi:hypothetical protein
MTHLPQVKITLGTLLDIRKSMCTTGVNYNGGKFATGITETGCPFCHPEPLVSLIPVANLPSVSTSRQGINDTSDKFASGVNDYGGK